MEFFGPPPVAPRRMIGQRLSGVQTVASTISSSPMTLLGILLFSSTVIYILYRYGTAQPVGTFPRYGSLGAAILISGEILMFAQVEPVATYFTAIAWTGYILCADAAVFSLRGKSLLRTYPGGFACLAVLSIPLWLIFEAYNLGLRNWIYVGLPQNRLARLAGYAWSFATIWPGIFETAALLRASGRNPGRRPSRDREGAVAPSNIQTPLDHTALRAAKFAPVSVVVGALFLVLPVLLPSAIRPYLFGAVWLGFIFFLEPINYRIGAESLWRDFERGDVSRLISLLASGAVCGILWEFWNFWAQARWVYVFPMFERWKMFAMPLAGYLGFPAFAVECFAMFAFLVAMINRVLKMIGAGARFRREALEL
jgi:hypothetical protein